MGTGGVGFVFVVTPQPGSNMTAAALAAPALQFVYAPPDAVGSTILSVPNVTDQSVTPVVALGTIIQYAHPSVYILITVSFSTTINLVTNTVTRAVSLEDFQLFDRETLGDSGCFSLNSTQSCDWNATLSESGAGCGFYNTTQEQYLRCRFGNIPLTSQSSWGVLLVQNKDITLQTVISSGKRGLLSIVGSIGGAYSILYVPRSLDDGVVDCVHVNLCCSTRSCDTTVSVCAA